MRLIYVTRSNNKAFGCISLLCNDCMKWFLRMLVDSVLEPVLQIVIVGRARPRESPCFRTSQDLNELLELDLAKFIGGSSIDYSLLPLPWKSRYEATAV